VITNKLSELEKKYEGKEIPRPDHWGGFIIVPKTIEFWQGHEGRIHDRLKFQKENSGWNLVRLSP
jgi:pyridoxamine 5'-phosphate oxidase